MKLILWLLALFAAAVAVFEIVTAVPLFAAEANAAISAFFSAFSVLLEPESRRSEIALFIVPRFFETLWNFLKKRKLARPIPGGEVKFCFIFAI